MREAVEAANAQLAQVLLMVNKELVAIRQEWLERYRKFDQELAEAVSRIDVDNKGLAALRTRLIELQTEKAKLDAQQTQLNDEFVPNLATAYRKELIAELIEARKARRRRREDRIKALNKLMGGIVRIRCAVRSHRWWLRSMRSAPRSPGSTAWHNCPPRRRLT